MTFNGFQQRLEYGQHGVCFLIISEDQIETINVEYVCVVAG